MVRKLYSFVTKYLYAGVGCLYCFTFGLLRRENRAYLADIAEQYGWKNPEKPVFSTLVPLLNPYKNFPNGVSIEIHDPMGSDGNVSLLELFVLNTLIKLKKPKSIFEFGTFDGRTTLNLAANANAEARVYTLDLPENKIDDARKNPLGDAKFVGKKIVGQKYSRTPFQNKIVELRGDSTRFDYSPYTTSMDFIFIDGAHSYDYVLSDTRNALAMIREGGIIAWHDYRTSCKGVTKVLNTLYAQGGIYKNLRWIQNMQLVILVPEVMLHTWERGAAIVP